MKKQKIVCAYCQWEQGHADWCIYKEKRKPWEIDWDEVSFAVWITTTNIGVLGDV